MDLNTILSHLKKIILDRRKENDWALEIRSTNGARKGPTGVRYS